MNNEIVSLYGNKVRIRVCGLCWQHDQLLMVNHSIYEGKNFWAPPGGGVEPGQTLETALRKELQEETGLDITVERFRFIVEFIKAPLHAIEIFFDISLEGGSLKTGFDPEMKEENQIIKEVKFLTEGDLDLITPAEKHGILGHCKRLADLRSMSGFYRI